MRDLDWKGFDVLVVDDEPDNLDAFRFAFRKSYRLHFAAGGAAAIALLDEVQAEVDKEREVTVRGAGEWAVHVESTRRILNDWGELHAMYDIQFAAATDGGLGGHRSVRR